MKQIANNSIKQTQKGGLPDSIFNSLNFEKIPIIVLLIIYIFAFNLNADTKKPSIFVKPFTKEGGVTLSDAQLKNANSELVDIVVKSKKYKVSESATVKQIMDSLAQKQKIGCTNTDECEKQLLKAASTDFLITGEILKLENKYKVTLKLIQRTASSVETIGTAKMELDKFESSIFTRSLPSLIAQLHNEKVEETTEQLNIQDTEDSSRLVINTNPPGASVIIFDQKKGETPFAKLFPNGKHIVIIQKEFFETETLRAELPAKKEYSINLRRQKHKFTLKLKNMDDGVQVINEEKKQLGLISNSAPLVLNMEAGEYVLNLEREGYESKSISGKLDNSKLEEVTMQKKKFTLDITSNIKDAEIFANNNRIGKTPLKKELEYGDYTIRIAKDGYKEIIQKVLLKSNIASKFDLVEQSGVPFEVVSNVKDLEIYIHDANDPDFTIQRGKTQEKIPTNLYWTEGKIGVTVKNDFFESTKTIELKPFKKGFNKQRLNFAFNVTPFKVFAAKIISVSESEVTPEIRKRNQKMGLPELSSSKFAQAEVWIKNNKVGITTEQSPFTGIREAGKELEVELKMSFLPPNPKGDFKSEDFILSKREKVTDKSKDITINFPIKKLKVTTPNVADATVLLNKLDIGKTNGNYSSGEFEWPVDKNLSVEVIHPFYDHKLNKKADLKDLKSDVVSFPGLYLDPEKYIPCHLQYYYQKIIGISFYYPLSINSKGCKYFQLNFLYDKSYEINGLDLGLGVNNVNNLSGVQIGVLGNTVEIAKALQISAAYNNVDNEITGMQLSGGGNLAANAYGSQIGLFNIVEKNMYGFQIGGVNKAGEHHGTQIGTVNINTDRAGLQVGLANIGKGWSSFQFSFFNLTKEGIGQFGIFNNADTKSLLQIGLVGISRKSGMQISGLNMANDSEILQLSLANIVKNEVSGLQISLANITDKCEFAAQIAMLWNYAESKCGFMQVSSYNYAKEFHGILQTGFMNYTEGDGFSAVQLALVNSNKDMSALQMSLRNANDNFTGVQVGLFNSNRRKITGAQMGLWNDNKEVTGFQFGLLNSSEKMDAIAIAPINYSDNMNGISVGAYNSGGISIGIQFGLWNVAEKNDRAQIGILNYVSGKSKLQVGVLNIAWGNPIPILPIANFNF